MTRGKGKSEEDECIDQVQSEVQRGRVPTYIGGASPINDHDMYVRKWEVISNITPPQKRRKVLSSAHQFSSRKGNRVLLPVHSLWWMMTVEVVSVQMMSEVEEVAQSIEKCSGGEA